MNYTKQSPFYLHRKQNFSPIRSIAISSIFSAILLAFSRVFDKIEGTRMFI